MYVHVVRALQQHSRFFMGVNTTYVFFFLQFAQSVCLSFRQTPCCYRLAQRHTKRDKGSERGGGGGRGKVRRERRENDKVTHMETQGRNKTDAKRHFICLCVRFCKEKYLPVKESCGEKNKLCVCTTCTMASCVVDILLAVVILFPVLTCCLIALHFSVLVRQMDDSFDDKES